LARIVSPDVTTLEQGSLKRPSGLVALTGERFPVLLAITSLVASAVLGYVASERQLTWALSIILGIGVTLVILRWPPLGLAMAISAGMVVPFLGPSGLNVSVVLVALLLGLWLLNMAVRQRQLRLVSSPAVWLSLCFIVIALLAFGAGQLSWFTFAEHAPMGAQLGGLAIIVLSVGAFLLAAHQIQDEKWLRAMVWSFLAIATVSILARSVLPQFGLSTQALFQPVGTMFWIWVVGHGVSQAFINHDLHPSMRIALLVLVLISFYVLLVQKFDDKSGWVSALICVAVILGARWWRVGIALVVITLLSAGFLASQVVAFDSYSISTRADAWLIMVQIIKVSPLWGLGFANYYWYTPLFPIRGYAVNFNSHNNYLDIVAQTGLLGLLFFLLFIGYMGWLAWRLRHEMQSGFSRAYAYAALGGLVAMVVAAMLGDWVLPFFYNIGLNGFRSSVIGWLFLGGLASLETLVVSSKRRV
jgi:O-antigen ligase